MASRAAGHERVSCCLAREAAFVSGRCREQQPPATKTDIEGAIPPVKHLEPDDAEGGRKMSLAGSCTLCHPVVQRRDVAVRPDQGRVARARCMLRIALRAFAPNRKSKICGPGESVPVRCAVMTLSLLKSRCSTPATVCGAQPEQTSVSRAGALSGNGQRAAEPNATGRGFRRPRIFHGQEAESAGPPAPRVCVRSRRDLRHTFRVAHAARASCYFRL